MVVSGRVRWSRRRNTRRLRPPHRLRPVGSIDRRIPTQSRKWSVATDRNGIPIGWEIAGANRNDCVLLEPTLDAIDGRGLLDDVDTMHLDRGYDNNVVRALCAQVGLDDLIVAKKRKAGEGKVKVNVSLGMRWPVERTNSWLSNFGQLRRNTDRFIHHRLDSIALAIALVVTVKLIKWADRFNMAT